MGDEIAVAIESLVGDVAALRGQCDHLRHLIDQMGAEIVRLRSISDDQTSRIVRAEEMTQLLADNDRLRRELSRAYAEYHQLQAQVAEHESASLIEE